MNAPFRIPPLRRNGLTTGRWVNGLAEWVEGDTAYLSIAFTWRLNEAYQRAIFYRAQGFKVRAGGPGIFTRKHYLADVAEIGGSIPDALRRHNPMATRAILRFEGAFAFRRSGKMAHRIELHPIQRWTPRWTAETIGERPCWTLFITGRNVRSWGFHCPKGWVHWRDFTNPADDGRTVGRGCGEP